MKYIQYGCGFIAPENWQNYDSSPTLRFERIPLIGKLYTRNIIRFPKNVRYGDIVKGLPVSDNSCKGVYCAHVLEHLSLTAFRIALKNTYRILENGGFFRFVLPDLEYSINEYIKNSSDDAAIKFLQETSLGQMSRCLSLKSFFKDWLGNSRHFWMWDYKSIKSELENIGFKNVRRAVFSDSIDIKFNEVEILDRWQNCLGVECQKI